MLCPMGHREMELHICGRDGLFYPLLPLFGEHIVFEAMDRSNWILPVDEIWIDELI